jgi:dihydrofolate reductase
MMAMEILAKRALNLAALFLVLIVCPESIRAQPVVTAGSRLSDAFAASTPVMNTAREAATATLLRNGKVLIAGGSDGSIILSSTELYDPTTNTFAKSTPLMNVARDNATATLLRDGKVLIAGGGGVSASLSSAELYDPATNTFAPSASTPVMNTARYFATATLLSKGKVLIAGGINGGTSLRSTELYNWATNTFTASTSTPVMNSPRQYATATLMRNGKVLIGGGQDLVSSHLYNSLSSTDLYDPNTNTFAPATSTPVMNTARDLATATALRNGKVLIAGGESFVGAPPGTTILSSTELYSPGRPR